MESQLRLTVVLGLLHSLYTLPEGIVDYFWCAIFETFRYLYCKSGESLNCFGVSAQTDSGIRISAFLTYPTQKFLWLCLVCTSLRLSGISTISQERF